MHKNHTTATERHTVVGSSKGVSMGACRIKTFPRQALHKIRSKAANRSWAITPATNLEGGNRQTEKERQREIEKGREGERERGESERERVRERGGGGEREEGEGERGST